MMDTSEYILGIDLGTTSIGWAIIRTANGEPVEVQRTGVRIFPAGVDGNIEKGKDSSRATLRRAARLQRRQTFRRAQRLRRIFRALRDAGLLPSDAHSEATERHAALANLDATLRPQFVTPHDDVQQQTWLYRLRAVAAESPLDQLAVGRALYHLGQRRGYLSNRKAPVSNDEDLGKVESGIKALESDLGGRTLGQYFATLNPHEERIRRRWTSRRMYREEFEQIWKTQAAALGLDDATKHSIEQAIFFQRPLKSQNRLVGKCALEPIERRAPASYLLAQKFRILQTVNHLRARFADGREAPLTEDQRATLIERLNDVPKLTTAAARKLLSLPRDARFSIEEFGEKELVGNRTRAAFLKILGERWNELTDDQRNQLVSEVANYQKPEALVRRAINHWGFTPAEAAALNELRLEGDYARHSRKALEKLVAIMRSGVAYTTACETIYGKDFRRRSAMKCLPPVLEALPDLRNPSVARALTELRKVVNGLIRHYGKPTRIRLELARDLKRSRKDRKRMSERMEQNRKEREKAIGRILKELPGVNPTHDAIEKVLLAEECGWQCPFTGSGISMRDLLGPESKFDVAHLYPRRFLDDSFANKTLCRADINRHRMFDLLPKGAFGSNAEEWAEILQRVKGFKSTAAAEKLKRFLADEVPDDFVSRQLNDTRYNSSAAADYLSRLYGGRYDESGQRVECLAGGITALLRGGWRLRKSRDDHRHHALDAVVVAMTSPGTVALLQAAAARSEKLFQRLLAEPLVEPFPGFFQQVHQRLDEIIVSHRIDRRVQGELHQATIYAPPITDGDGKSGHRVRKELHKLTVTELARIVDPVIRELVLAKWRELGEKAPDKVFADPSNHPVLPNRNGSPRPIHKVRIWVTAKPARVGGSNRERLVSAAANHHMAILARLDGSRNETRWEDVIVPRREAAERVASGQSAVQFDWGEDRHLKFTLRPNDCLELDGERGGREIYRVVNISKGDMQIQQHADARDSKSLKEQRARIRICRMDDLRTRRARKVVVCPIGIVMVSCD